MLIVLSYRGAYPYSSAYCPFVITPAESCGIHRVATNLEKSGNLLVVREKWRKVGKSWKSQGKCGV